MTIVIDIASVAKNFFIRVEFNVITIVITLYRVLMLQIYDEKQTDAIVFLIMFLNSSFCNVTFPILQRFVSMLHFIYLSW